MGLICLFAVLAPAATVKETQAFLRDHRHAWLPYPFPSETATTELSRLLHYDFDTIDLSFAGSYHGGHIDFSALDAAVRLIGGKGKRVVLTLTPRFDATDGVFDRLSDGSVITNVPYKNPNASMIDIFDPQQRGKYGDYVASCIRHYQNDPHMAGYILGWGYMGETGLFIGDYLENFNLIGSVASGYSEHALEEFNRWRAGLGLPALGQLPMPSVAGNSADYILFHRFRCEFVGGVFQKEAVARAQALTPKPVGTWGYLSVNAGNYGRNWALTPNADFLRSAVSAASFDLRRTLLDSAMGYEDHELSDGPWRYTTACVECALARQIAHGGFIHAMPIRDYDKPPWETNFFPRIADFVVNQKQLAAQVRATPPDVALFQPTWSFAALPVRGANNLFVPRTDAQNRCEKMIGLAESFGLPYQLITERDLLQPRSLRKFRHILIPLWDLMPEILDKKIYTKWASDARLVPIPSGNKMMTRSEFRDLLRARDIPMKLDFDSDRILAGRVNNLIFNWNDQPTRVSVGDKSYSLQPMEYRFLP